MSGPRKLTFGAAASVAPLVVGTSFLVRENIAAAEHRDRILSGDPSVIQYASLDATLCRGWPDIPQVRLRRAESVEAMHAASALGDGSGPILATGIEGELEIGKYDQLIDRMAAHVGQRLAELRDRARETIRDLTTAHAWIDRGLDLTEAGRYLEASDTFMQVCIDLPESPETSATRQTALLAGLRAHGLARHHVPRVRALARRIIDRYERAWVMAYGREVSLPTHVSAALESWQVQPREP